ncbi:hypothetical protein WISP_48755 [Willisornis vidua]|uniref:Uncharacterized protein n=1 Tax=Willisornis vidua TaxID=1566151 RepID=A0ABQ9DEC6_9PASS|nr:hypothetical protein WISP_48755 [Willisornis vidua]
MLAARTGTVGGKSADESLKLRKQSVLSLGSRDRALKASSDSGKEGRARPGQPQQRARRLALLRELEMNWYLRVCELSHEYTIAYTTGMPHRWVPRLCPGRQRCRARGEEENGDNGDNSDCSNISRRVFGFTA